ncbi:unnamed protein product [Arabis nemorensis]|uniref:Uncharacterized protein n=1 Tax=Arabis nemorensis TaxID=586526 RepID=A0A565CB67_9BRAS|nr:unnamed protein product [Arabis nemorensis]
MFAVNDEATFTDDNSFVTQSSRSGNLYRRRQRLRNDKNFMTGSPRDDSVVSREGERVDSRRASW